MLRSRKAEYALLTAGRRGGGGASRRFPIWSVLSESGDTRKMEAHPMVGLSLSVRKAGA